MIIVHILLWILKIAGILLLLVLGLLLLGILTVLFVPVRYELSASGDIEEPEKITGKISIRYFFRLIRFQAAYENQKSHWMAGIAWKKIGQDKNEEPEEEIQEKETPEKYKEDKKVPGRPEDGTREPEEQEGRGKENDSRKREAAKKEKPDPEKKQEEKSEKEKPQSRKGEKKESGWQRISGKIKYTFQRICDKIKTLSKTKDRIEKFIKDEVHQSAFKKGKIVLIHFIKTWMPKEARGYVEYGFDDPYYTGKLLSWLALFYPFFGKWLQIAPDFEKPALNGSIFIKGHLRMNHLAAAAVRLVADKNIRSTAKEVLHLLKRQKKEES